MKGFILWSFAVLLATVTSGQAEVRRVPTEYSGIQTAIRGCNDGDVVIVEPGTYYETINFSGKNVILTSIDPNDPAIVAGTVINALRDGTVVTFESGETPEAVLTGFTITGGYGTFDPSVTGDDRLFWGAGIFCNYASPTIMRNVITANYAPCPTGTAVMQVYDVSYGGAIGGDGCAAIITHNIIKRNSAYAGGGILVFGDPTISNNIIYNNSAAIGGGVVMFGGRLINNTIVDNSINLNLGGVIGNVYAVLDPMCETCTVSNNIIAKARTGGGIYLESALGDSVRFNNVWANSPGNYITVDTQTGQATYGGLADRTGLYGNISEDPLFVDPVNEDYHLQSGSPCVSAGDPNFVPEAGETDIDGDPRIFAFRVDIGADEHVGYVKPVACAGRDQHVLIPELITLDASESFFSDPCGVMTFQWSQTAGPNVVISDPAVMRPTFMPASEGWYRFGLVVGDGLHTSEPDEVLVIVGNQSPVADAGSDTLFSAPGFMQLDGSGSYDPDPPDELMYAWKQLQGPEVVDFVDANTATPEFFSNVEGVYVFELVVNDGFVDSEPDTVMVEAGVVTSNAEFFDVSSTGQQGIYYPDVFGTKVIFSAGDAYDPYSWDIKVIDLVAGYEDTFVAGGIDTQPKIDGDRMVWSGGPNYLGFTGPECTGVFVADIVSGEQQTLRAARNTESYSYPVISGNKVVWLQHLGVNKNDYANWNNMPYDICGADITDLENPVYFTIAEDVGRRAPYPYDSAYYDFDDVIDISGDIVVWEGDGNIYGADISNINDIRVFIICDHPAQQYDPAISGNLVVWTDERDDAGDIYGANISDVENVQELEIIKAFGAQLQPAIDGCLIAYVEGDISGGQIKLCCMTKRHGVLDIPIEDYLYGAAPAIDGQRIVWGSADGQSRGIFLEFGYSVLDGAIQNLTKGKRYDYIQHAINAAADGDRIVISEGVYHEKVDLAGKAVMVSSADPNNPAAVAATVLNGSGQVVTFADGEGPDCVVRGLTISNGYRSIYCSGASPTIARCRIIGNLDAGIRLWNGSNPTIEGCTISGNGGAGIEMFMPRTGRRVRENYATISNCLVVANRQQGVSSGAATINNCTIVENFKAGVSCSTSTITNSIIYYNGFLSDGAQIDSSQATVSYCDVQSGWQGVGNIDTDPCFVERGRWSAADINVRPEPGDRNTVWVNGGDYHLQSGSLCIDAGDPTYIPQLGETDLDGKVRVVGQAVDMGAFEFQAAVDIE